MDRACPCCGYLTLPDSHPGSFDLCPICYWEDDPIQLAAPDYAGGANPFSLRQSQQNYIAIGACDETMLKNVRPACESDRRDPAWLPLRPA
jgi:hypothetical protein